MLICQGAHLRTSLEKSLQFRVRKRPCARNDKGKHVINIDKKTCIKAELPVCAKRSTRETKRTCWVYANFLSLRRTS